MIVFCRRNIGIDHPQTSRHAQMDDQRAVAGAKQQIFAAAFNCINVPALQRARKARGHRLAQCAIAHDGMADRCAAHQRFKAAPCGFDLGQFGHDDLGQAAADAVDAGYTILILSDRDADRMRAPIPSLLATAGVHHHLVRQKERTMVSLVVEAGDVREVHHVALLIGYGASAINPSVFPKFPVHAGRDLQAVTLLVDVPGALGVHAAVPVATLKEFIDYAKARPGQLNYGSSSASSAQSLAMEYFMGKAGIKPTGLQLDSNSIKVRLTDTDTQLKAKDAIATIQAGIAKKPTSPTDAQLRLGTAYLAAGQKADAVKGVDEMAKLAQEMVDSVFSFGELGMQEFETMGLITGVLEQGGFRVERERPPGEDEAPALDEIAQRLGALLEAGHRRKKTRLQRIVEKRRQFLRLRQVGQGVHETLQELGVGQGAEPHARDHVHRALALLHEDDAGDHVRRQVAAGDAEPLPPYYHLLLVPLLIAWIAALALSRRGLSRFLSTRALVLGGFISYSLYMTHLVWFGLWRAAMSAVGIDSGPLYAVSVVALVAGALVIAWLMWRLPA